MKTYILHLSDLHFVKNAAAYNTEEIIIREAEEKVKDVPRGNKLLVVTGDFHNFSDADYSRAEFFLKNLVAKMGLIMEQDVFVIPGNHDVGNDAALKPLLETFDPDWKSHKKSALSMLKRGDKEFLSERLRVFRPYCAFVQRLGIYDSSLGEDYPAQTHVRSWRGRLNILHLNTALIADGKSKKNHQTDADGAANQETWKDYYSEDIPSIALGHNSYYDIKQKLRKDLAGTFALRNISVYLCGDRHRTEQDTEQKNITIVDGHKNEKRIPNMVAAKGIADGDDTYSEVGFSWHIWDEDTDDVSVELRKWTRDTLGKTESGGDVDGYEMRRLKLNTSKTGNNPITITSASLERDEPHTALQKYLAEVLKQKRDSHPSFRLLKVDEIDSRLFPKVEEYYEIPPRGSVDADHNTSNKASLVWDIIQESWPQKDHRSIVIIGEGGIGKTITLFSVTNASGKVASVPALYIPMYELVNTNGTLLGIMEYIKGYYPEHGDQILEIATQTWNESPQLLLLLDGFNEVPSTLRRTVLKSINKWHDTHPGVQLIAVSRPMDGLNLSQELAGNPISITLAPLETDVVREYLKDAGRKAPYAKASIWKDLHYPLFLNLYIKTGKLREKKASGYPLHVRVSENGGSLIWNYLQRELLRHSEDEEKKAEDWVIRCSVANEFVLPYIAYRMVSEQKMDISYDYSLKLIDEALNQLNSKHLPHHLQSIWERYRRQHGGDYPQRMLFTEQYWKDTVLQDSGVLVSESRIHDEKDNKFEDSNYVFMHQNFRDCLAGLYLVNQAEITDRDEFPAIWGRVQSLLALKYAAELIEPAVLDKLWDSNRMAQQYKKTEYRKNHIATCNLLELYKRNESINSELDFSGMDLCGLSLTNYLGKDRMSLPLFRNRILSKETRLDRAVFESEGHSNTINDLTVLLDGRVVSSSRDKTLRVWDVATGQCLQTLKGHEDSVTCAAALTDGCVVSGSADHTIRVWDVSTGQCLQVLKGHGDAIRSIDVLQGNCVVSGSDDHTIRTWDTSTGQCLHIMKGHRKPIRCLKALSNGCIISGSDDHTLRVWDATTGQCLQKLKGHSGTISCMAVLSDRQLVTGSDDHTLRIWDTSTGQCLKTLNGHSAQIRCITILPDGRVVTGSNDHTLRVWDASTGYCLYILNGHKGTIRCIAVLPDGCVVSGSYDHTLRVWDASTGQCLQKLERHQSKVSCMVVLSDGRIVSGSLDQSLRVWNPTTGQCLQTMDGYANTVYCVAALPDGRVISGSNDCTIRVWDASTGQCLKTMTGHKNTIRNLAVLPNSHVLSGSTDHTLRVWDVSTGQCLHILKGHSNSISCVDVFPDGNVVSGSLSRPIVIWNSATGKALKKLYGHNHPVHFVGILASSQVISGSEDHTLRVWDSATGLCSKVLKDHTGTVRCVALLPDGRVVTGSSDRTLRVWDIPTGQCLQVLNGHMGIVTCVAVLPGGRIVSGSADGTLRVWETSNGHCIHTLKGHMSSVQCVSVLPNGYLVSGSSDSTLRVWDSSTGQCLRILEGHQSWITCTHVLQDGHVVSASGDSTLRVWDINTGTCKVILEATEIPVFMMDFSEAILADDLARLLWQNNARIPDSDITTINFT